MIYWQCAIKNCVVNPFFLIGSLSFGLYLGLILFLLEEGISAIEVTEMRG